MQLILETEAAPDLDIKMTSLETKDVQEFSRSADDSKKVVPDIENGQNKGEEIANDNTQEITNGNNTSESNTNEDTCSSEELSTNGDNKVKDVTENQNSDNNSLCDETESISKSGSPVENNAIEIQTKMDVTDNKEEITEGKDCIKTASVLESECNTNASAETENCDNANSNNDCSDVTEPKQSHSSEDSELLAENKKNKLISVEDGLPEAIPSEASIEVQNTEDLVSSDKEMPTNDDVNTTNGVNEEARKPNCALETDLIDNVNKNELDNNLKEKNDFDHSLTLSPKNVMESMEVDLCADDSIVDKCDSKENVTKNTDVEVIETVIDENIEKKNNDDVMEDKSLENQQNSNDSEADIVCVEIKDDSDECPAKSTKPKSEEVTNKNVVKRNTLMTLSNTLDILSDEEGDTEETNKTESNDSAENSNPSNNDASANSKCINIDDDDDVMVIDDESTLKVLDDPKNTNVETSSEIVNEDQAEKVISQTIDIEKQEKKLEDDLESSSDAPDAASSIKDVPEMIAESPKVSEKLEAENNEIPKIESKPLIPDSFLKTFKTKVSEMTRDDLEEFCLLKIVEGIIDKSGLSEIKTKLKNLSQNVEEWKKKALMLTKQNKDLKIVLKAVQEEQRKRSDSAVVPLKITRSVGMQVFMSDNADRGNVRRKQNPTQVPPPRNNKTAIMPKPVNKPTSSNLGQIPVPRLVPAANNSPVKPKPPSQIQNYTVSSNTRQVNTTPNGVKKSPSLPQKSEKRSFSQMQQQHQSVTVDLTDDEPPSKQQTTSKNVSQSPVRLVSPQQLLTPRAQMSQGINGPRNVYIPINSTGSPSIRPGQAIMLKSVPGSRVRGNLVRLPPNTVRLPRANGHRHPAPLPEVDKQQQPPNWKAIPPAPDLKISKVENGIVVSWKIEDYQEDSYEEIASYQLFAYQESNSPPDSTNWKKIGDVKALPLPMACTLTQFMAGFKYFFAVRAVDIRSRFGPFSLPGSILLLNK